MICRILTTLLVLTALAGPSWAGPFSRKPANKPDPAEQVPTLIKTLQSDPDERKREEAAGELREFDLKTFPDIMPALIEALGNDPSTAVRIEAVNSIGKSRPISQPAGYALEQAAANDTAFRVRAAAKSNLIHWVAFLGYRQSRANDNVQNQTDEPPLAPVMPKDSKAPAANSKDKPPATIGKPASSTSRPLFPLLSRSGKEKEDGPALNPPK